MSKIPINGPCQPGDGWIFAGGGGGGRPIWRGLMELGDQSSHRPNWSPQISKSPATNGLAETETCLMVDVIRQHARRHKRRPVSLFAHNPGAICSLLTYFYVFFFLAWRLAATWLSVWQVCCAYRTGPPPGRTRAQPCDVDVPLGRG